MVRNDRLGWATRNSEWTHVKRRGGCGVDFFCTSRWFLCLCCALGLSQLRRFRCMCERAKIAVRMEQWCSHLYSDAHAEVTEDAKRKERVVSCV